MDETGVTVEATMCRIIYGNRLLLQRKSAGLFGEGTRMKRYVA